MTDVSTEAERLTREITIDAPVEEVWEAVSTDAGRERWLEPDPGRRIVVEESQAPSRISWWWWNECDDEPARHVNVDVVAAPDGARVIVTESRPAVLPLARLSCAVELICT